MNRGDKAFRMVAFVHKLCPVIPLHKRPQKDMGNDDSRVGAGEVWSGEGMLASPMVGERSPRVGRCKHPHPYALSPTHCIPAGRPQGSPPRSTPPPPLQRSAASRDPFVLIVRAGAVWSGVGTLAVALRGESVCVTLPALLPSQPHPKRSGRENPTTHLMA